MLRTAVFFALASKPCAKHLLVILLGLEGGLRNTVQVTLAGLCDAAATLVLVLLKDTDLLKSLHDLAVDGAGGVNVVGRAGAAVLGGSVDLAEAAYTNSLALFTLSAFCSLLLGTRLYGVLHTM